MDIGGDDALRELRRSCNTRLEELRKERLSWWDTWRDISWHVLPSRGRFLVTPNQPRGRLRQRAIVDRTATKAVSRLASFLMAGITSPSREWFRLGTGDPDLDNDDEVKGWCAECQRRMMQVFASGNFYNSIAQAYEELGAFGTGPMVVLRDYHDVARFYSLTAGEYMLGLDERMTVDTLYREFVRTVAQLKGEFGLENLSSTARGLYQNGNLAAESVVVHAMQPNRDRRPGALGWRGMPYQSVYFELGQEGSFLRIDGHHERPFVAPRWHAISNDAYGRGPGEDALPDTKTLQIQQRRFAEAVDKLVRPPVQGPISMEQQAVSLLPGAVNFLPMDDGKAGLRPVFQTPPNVQVLADKITTTQNTIKETFFNDLILMISQMESTQPITAEEVRARQEEKLLMLGPMLERFHNEGLAPVIDIVFGIMQRGGLLPPPPKALHDREITPQFVSVLAQAQKAVSTTGIEQLFRFAGGIAAVFPHVVDKLDPDAAVSDYADALAVDPRLIVPQDQADAARHARAQQMQAQQAMQASMAAAQGAKTLSETDLGGGQNALSMMTGLGGGGGGPPPQQ